MSKRRTFEEFVRDANAKHGNKYDYSQVQWGYCHDSITIICPIHGPFQQVASCHLYGDGCPECGGTKKKTTKQFIEEATAVWGDRIDFSKTIYENGKKKAIFTCPIHGDFKQRPISLLNGHGCQKCGWDSAKTLVLGVGINDLNVGGNNPLYKTWISMLQRGYSDLLKQKYPTYQDVTVCDEWFTLSNFKRWFDENYVEGYHLDKDIIVKGNKVYSAATCCFLPREINQSMKSYPRNKYGLPKGVTPKGKFFSVSARFGGKLTYIGGFTTPEAAFLAYKKAKENYVKELAEKYYKEGKITERVYNALLVYEVEITD